MESILQKERSLTDLERETFFRRLGLLLQGSQCPSSGHWEPWKATAVRR